MKHRSQPRMDTGDSQRYGDIMESSNQDSVDNHNAMIEANRLNNMLYDNSPRMSVGDTPAAMRRPGNMTGNTTISNGQASAANESAAPISAQNLIHPQRKLYKDIKMV